MSILQFLTEIINNNADPRVNTWFLMESVEPVLIIVGVYWVFCLYLGPRIMKDRQPFQLKNTILAYNAINVISCAWVVYESLTSGWWRDYSFRCQPVDYSDNPKALRMAASCWVFFMLKIYDLLDTVFFVLRKKNNQVTFLHLYHHVTTPVLSWCIVKVVPGGFMTFGMPINSFVHVVMYSYYLLAALGPQYHKYLWWKKYITQMQLIQFVVALLFYGQMFVLECDFPKTVPCLWIVNIMVNFYLFSKFYRASYTRLKSATKNQ